MRPFPILDQLPEGFRVERAGGGVLAVREDLAAPLRAAGFTADGDEAFEASDLAGRSPMGEISLPEGRFVVRRFHHGGVLRWLTRGRFADPERPFRELALAAELARRGVPTTEIVAARARPARPVGWRLEIVSRRLEHVWDAAEVLEALRAGELGPAARRTFLAELGRRIGSLHRVGFLHADLHPRNLLFARDLAPGGTPGEPGEPVRSWVLDLDRSRFLARLDEDARRANLRRFLRAVRRREERGRAFLRPLDAVRFLRAYGAELGRAGWSWREDLAALQRGARREERWHRWSWRAEELLGGGPETRDGRAVVRR